MPAALRASAKGARIISAGIHMSDIPSFPYEILWGERTPRLGRQPDPDDGEEFLALAPEVPVRTEVELHPLAAPTRRSTRSAPAASAAPPY